MTQPNQSDFQTLEEVSAEELNDYLDNVEKEIIQLKKERDELKAQVEQLRLAALRAISFMPGGEAKATLRDAYDATPAQCLAARDAEIVRVAFIAAINATGQGYNGEIGLSDDEIVDLAELYVKRKVSQQAKGE